MGYLYLGIVAILFSCGGICVKLEMDFFSPEYITFLRFVVGVLLLMGLKLIRGEKPRLILKNRWIWIGGIGKAFAYLLENYGLSIGTSYGNILVWPVQTILSAFLSVMILKETFGTKKAICCAMCIGGVCLISWNGVDLAAYFSENGFITMLFVLTGIFAVVHVWSQKMVVHSMDLIDLNLSMFTVGAIVSLIPLPISGQVYGMPDGWGFFAIVFFGFITGIGFFLSSEGMKRVPFYLVSVIQSSTIILSIMWGVVLFHEPLSVITIIGTILFLVGLVVMNLPGRARAAA